MRRAKTPETGGKPHVPDATGANEVVNSLPNRGSLFTVGHSNHSLEAFLELLKKHTIQVLVDTRSYPYSRHVPHFNREELCEALRQRGIKYLFLGGELGGRPTGEEFYDEEGHVLYCRLAESPTF